MPGCSEATNICRVGKILFIPLALNRYCCYYSHIAYIVFDQILQIFPKVLFNMR